MTCVKVTRKCKTIHHVPTGAQKHIFKHRIEPDIVEKNCLGLLVLTSSASFQQGELLSPCRCSGSVRCTHQPCLIKWISERGSWACELCYYKYQVIAISTKNPLQVSCRLWKRFKTLTVRCSLWNSNYLGVWAICCRLLEHHTNSVMKSSSHWLRLCLLWHVNIYDMNGWALWGKGGGG